MLDSHQVKEINSLMKQTQIKKVSEDGVPRNNVVFLVGGQLVEYEESILLKVSEFGIEVHKLRTKQQNSVSVTKNDGCWLK